MWPLSECEFVLIPDPGYLPLGQIAPSHVNLLITLSIHSDGWELCVFVQFDYRFIIWRQAPGRCTVLPRSQRCLRVIIKSTVLIWGGFRWYLEHRFSNSYPRLGHQPSDQPQWIGLWNLDDESFEIEFHPIPSIYSSAKLLVIIGLHALVQIPKKLLMSSWARQNRKLTATNLSPTPTFHQNCFPSFPS